MIKNFKFYAWKFYITDGYKLKIGNEIVIVFWSPFFAGQTAPNLQLSDSGKGKGTFMFNKINLQIKFFFLN